MNFDIFSSFQFSKIPQISSIFVPVPFCKLVRIWTLLLSIYIDSKELQSNFEVSAVFGSTYFWVSLYKLPTVIIEYDGNLFVCKDFVPNGQEGRKENSNLKNREPCSLR